MTRRICISSAILLLLAWLVIPESGAQQNDKNPNAAKIQELLQQRHNALQQRYEAIRRRYDDGSLSFDHVVPALDDVLKAKLELAPTRQEQIEVCKQRIDNLRTLEEHVEAKVNAGQGRTDERHAATAARIQAEIDCLRLESDPD
jgi:outer membrane protein TolC